VNLLGMDIPELAKVVKDLGEPDYRARQIFYALYRQRTASLEDVSTLPVTFRTQAGERGISIIPAKIEKQFRSVDGTIRYLIGFEDGQLVETV
jgi:23S rRNA (adenine2503-C2)-methyltransferase